jgi:hypothetical protein
VANYYLAGTDTNGTRLKALIKGTGIVDVDEMTGGCGM